MSKWSLLWKSRASRPHGFNTSRIKGVKCLILRSSEEDEKNVSSQAAPLLHQLQWNLSSRTWCQNQPLESRGSFTPVRPNPGKIYSTSAGIWFNLGPEDASVTHLPCSPNLWSLSPNLCATWWDQRIWHHGLKWRCQAPPCSRGLWL